MGRRRPPTPRTLRPEVGEPVELVVVDLDDTGWLVGDLIGSGERVALRLPRTALPHVRRALSPGDSARLTLTQARSRGGLLVPQVRAELLR